MLTNSWSQPGRAGEWTARTGVELRQISLVDAALAINGAPARPARHVLHFLRPASCGCYHVVAGCYPTRATIMATRHDHRDRRPWPPPSVVPVHRLGFGAKAARRACLAACQRQHPGAAPPAPVALAAVFAEETLAKT